MNLLLPFLLLAVQSDTHDAELRRVLITAVRVEALEGRYLSITIDSVPATDPAAPLVNGRPQVFGYLLYSVPALQLFKGVDPHANESARTLRLIENVLGDSAASSALAAYYRALQPTLASAASGSNTPTIVESQVLTIASRFFFPARILGDTVQVYRCTGINGVADLGAARNLLVEAFAFATIIDADSAAQVNRDFRAARRSVQRYAREGSDTSAALTEARADMYEAMIRSEGLRAILRKAYATWGVTLPFRVSAWQQ